MRIGVDIDDVLYPWHEQRPRLRDIVGPVLETALYGADPYPGAVAQLARLQAAGHTVHLITARAFEGGRHGAQIRDLTRQWAEAHDVPHDSLHFAQDKTKIPTDLFVDDNVHNIRSLGAAGVVAFLLDRPWNAHATGLPRVPSLTAFVDLVVVPTYCLDLGGEPCTSTAPAATVTGATSEPLGSS